MKEPNLVFRPFSMENLPDSKSSGIYVIKEGERVVYVGESHSGRLRKTFLRHFQGWNGKTSGFTYPRDGETLVAFSYFPPSEAMEMQNQLITRLQPRDNTNGAPPTSWTQAARDVLDAFDPF